MQILSRVLSERVTEIRRISRSRQSAGDWPRRCLVSHLIDAPSDAINRANPDNRSIYRAVTNFRRMPLPSVFIARCDVCRILGAIISSSHNHLTKSYDYVRWQSVPPDGNIKGPNAARVALSFGVSELQEHGRA